MPITQIDGILTGHLQTLQTVTGSISSTGTVTGTITIGGGGDYPAYTGEYVVTPTRSEQTLETFRKVMTDNVTILEIPYVAVSNPSGGKTYTIGGN